MALFDLGQTGYLGSTARPEYLFCANFEGWGPLSPTRYDFTPCFLDVWVASVAAFGILFGASAAWWLFKRKDTQLVPKNWHFYTKLVCWENRTPRLSRRDHVRC